MSVGLLGVVWCGVAWCGEMSVGLLGVVWFGSNLVTILVFTF